MADVTGAVKTAAEVENTPRGVVKRWIAELDIADETEKDWRKASDEIYDLYRSKKRQSNSFNILWSNTETLRPAIYNSTPHPDVRRRFRDADPVGKLASQVLERALTYQIDVYDFDFHMKQTALDMLLSGRGVARIKYMPVFDQDQVVDEGAICEHVDWDKFRRGAGCRWDDVQWVAFRHELQYEDLVKQFGKEIANEIPLTEVQSNKSLEDKDLRAFLKVATVWEIWDKSMRRVLFICPKYADQPLAVKDDPLGLEGFFPMPRPIYAIEDTTTLIPNPLYIQYKTQAEELNKVTKRIDKIVAAMKVRGAYHSHLAELKTIIESEDATMTAIENASEIANMGGLDKAIWMMPIENLATVLEGLYIARDKIIQVIYEITGLGDVMRGVANPHETATAQKLKSQWGSLRLQNTQRELQRFIRDLLRLKGEIMAEHFSIETFQAMTGIQLPMNADRAKLQMMIAQQGGQIPPEMQEQIDKALQTPTWEEVKGLLQSQKMRLYRVDIETDSTVAESVERDTQGLMECMGTVSKIFQDLGPAMVAGYMSVEVAKSLALSAARVSRAGQAVEDAIEQIQQPPPAPPEQDNSVEVAKVKAESDAAIAQMKIAHEQQMAAVQAQLEQQMTAAQEQAKQQTAAMQAELQQQTAQMQATLQAEQAAMAEKMKTERELMLEEVRSQAEATKTMFDGAVKIIIAEISAQQKAEAAQAAAEKKAQESPAED